MVCHFKGVICGDKQSIKESSQTFRSAEPFIPLELVVLDLQTATKCNLRVWNLQSVFWPSGGNFAKRLVIVYSWSENKPSITC